MNAPVNAEPVIKTLLSTKYFDVIDKDGYTIVKEPKPVNGVVVIPVLLDGRAVLGSLKRRAIDAMSIEFPRGKIDDGETAVEAAIRELREETGMEALKVKEIGKVHSNTSLLSSCVSICVASVTGKVEGKTDGEVDHTMIKTMEALQDMIAGGEITDGHTLSALMMLICNFDKP
jgi:ADP-ribose pyrophosphatase